MKLSSGAPPGCSLEARVLPEVWGVKSALLYVCKQPVSFAKGTNTLSDPGGFSPWPYKGNCKAVLGLRAEFGQREVLFSNMSSLVQESTHLGRAEDTTLTENCWTISQRQSFLLPGRVENSLSSHLCLTIHRGEILPDISIDQNQFLSYCVCNM